MQCWKKSHKLASTSDKKQIAHVNEAGALLIDGIDCGNCDNIFNIFCNIWNEIKLCP